MKLDIVDKRIKCRKGSERTRRRHLGRIETMAAAVEERFPEVKNVQQMRMKHCQWLLDTWCAATTRKDYRSSLRLLIEALDRDNWLNPLKMSSKAIGGRPRSVSVVRSRSSKFWFDER